MPRCVSGVRMRAHVCEGETCARARAREGKAAEKDVPHPPNIARASASASAGSDESLGSVQEARTTVLRACERQGRRLDCEVICIRARRTASYAALPNSVTISRITGRKVNRTDQHICASSDSSSSDSSPSPSSSASSGCLEAALAALAPTAAAPAAATAPPAKDFCR